jgi:hypothetical protein
MFWMVCAAMLIAVAGVPAVLLVERKSRQAKIAARLRIESGCGIVEEGFVRIGGIDQWIGIRGEDCSNPVLLMLHGGPAVRIPFSRPARGPGRSNSPLFNGTRGAAARPIHAWGRAGAARSVLNNSFGMR